MKKQAKLNTEIMAISDLLPADYNPRKDLTQDDIQYKQLRKSIQEFNYVDPLIYNTRTKTLVSGHQRLKVLKELGYEEIEVNCVCLDKPKEKALNIALNKISGEWDNEKLNEVLSGLSDFDFDSIGFNADELENLNKNIEIPDFEAIPEFEVPRLDRKSKIKCPGCGMEFIPR